MNKIDRFVGVVRADDGITHLGLAHYTMDRATVLSFLMTTVCVPSPSRRDFGVPRPTKLTMMPVVHGNMTFVEFIPEAQGPAVTCMACVGSRFAW